MPHMSQRARTWTNGSNHRIAHIAQNDFGGTMVFRDRNEGAQLSWRVLQRLEQLPWCVFSWWLGGWVVGWLMVELLIGLKRSAYRCKKKRSAYRCNDDAKSTFFR